VALQQRTIRSARTMGNKSRGSSCSNYTMAMQARVGRFPGHCLLTECSRGR